MLRPNTARFRDLVAQQNLGRAVSQHHHTDSGLSFIYYSDGIMYLAICCHTDSSGFCMCVCLFFLFVSTPRSTVGFVPLSTVLFRLKWFHRRNRSSFSVMESVACNTTPTDIINFPVSGRRSNDAFLENKRDMRVCLSLCSKIILFSFEGPDIIYVGPQRHRYAKCSHWD